MANKKISELNYANADQIDSSDVLTFVDVSETDVENINKKVTFDQFGQYLKEYTNLFPIPFNTQFIKPDAYIDGVETPISSKVAGQTVNLADIGSLKFDQYGRVYDYSRNSEQVSSEEIFMASGTAATWYKTRITENFDQPQPVNFTGQQVGNGDDNAGYFNRYSYWNPAVRGLPYLNAQRINYSDGLTNQYDWTHLFEKTYVNISTTKIEMVQGSDHYIAASPTTFTIYIYWKENKFLGNGLVCSHNNINNSVIWGDSNLSGTITHVAQINSVNTSYQNYARPKIIIDWDNKQILGLPLLTWIVKGNYANDSSSISLTITNYS